VLTNRLQALVRDGLLEREVHTSARSRTEYLVTPRCASLWPALLSIWEWERNWVATHREQLPAMRHESCGQLFTPLLRCDGCRCEVTHGDVALALGPSGAMSVFGNRWAAALLVAAFLDTTRFTDFQLQLGAPPSLLAERLQTFCNIGVLCTSPADPGGSERTTYLLTDKGRAFFPVLVAALQWAQQWFRAPDGPAMELTHRGCGDTFTGEFACSQCGEALAGAHISAVPA
jgi:DNA-binding HxlR family transcriptional regulator